MLLRPSTETSGGGHDVVCNYANIAIVRARRYHALSRSRSRRYSVAHQLHPRSACSFFPTPMNSTCRAVGTRARPLAIGKSGRTAASPTAGNCGALKTAQFLEPDHGSILFRIRGDRRHPRDSDVGGLCARDAPRRPVFPARFPAIKDIEISPSFSLRPARPYVRTCISVPHLLPYARRSSANTNTPPGPGRLISAPLRFQRSRFS